MAVPQPSGTRSERMPPKATCRRVPCSRDSSGGRREGGAGKQEALLPRRPLLRFHPPCLGLFSATRWAKAGPDPAGQLLRSQWGRGSSRCARTTLPAAELPQEAGAGAPQAARERGARSRLGRQPDCRALGGLAGELPTPTPRNVPRAPRPPRGFRFRFCFRSQRRKMEAAAAAAGSGGSGSAGLLPLLLPLLLLQPLRPALGNEGGATGRCECERHIEEPPIVRRFPDRLVAWEYCRDLVRFAFPRKWICGLAIAPWVIQFKTLQSKKERDRACKRCHQPMATSHGPPLPPSSGSPAGEVLKKTPAPKQVLALLSSAAQETLSGVTQPQNGAYAGMGPSKGPQEADPAPGSWVPVLCLLGISLLLVAVIVGLLCRRKLPWRSGVTLVPQNDTGI